MATDRQVSCNISNVTFNRIRTDAIAPTVSSLLNKLKMQAREQMDTRRPNLIKALQKMGDFYMELKWDFQSWGRQIHPAHSGEPNVF